MDTPILLTVFVCYRVWMTGDHRSRFMTSKQLRFHLGLLEGERLPDAKITLEPRCINWERVDGATEAKMVEWNLMGETVDIGERF